MPNPPSYTMNEKITDEDYVKAVQYGDTNAFEALVQRHQKKLFSLLYHWLGDYEDANEAAQEVFVSAFCSLGQFRGEAKFSTWLYRIAFNHASSRRKKLARTRRHMVALEAPRGENSTPAPADTVPDPGPNPAESAEQHELVAQVHAALATLDGDQAMLILMRDFDHLSYDEMARTLKVPRGTVKSRLHRARQALKEALAPYFESARVKQ